MAWYDTVTDNVDTYYASRFNDMVTALASGSVDGALIIADGTDGHKFKGSGKTFETSITDDDTKVPTSGAVYDGLAAKAPTASPVFTGNVTIPAGAHSITIHDYKDLMIQGCSVPLTNAATVDVEETGTNKNLIPYGQFTAAGENSEHLMWLIPFPDDWNSADADLGKIQFNIYWRPVSGTDDVKWQIAGKLLPDGDPIDVALATVGAVEDTVQNTTDMHVSSYTTAAVVSSAGGGGKFALFSVTRQAPAGTDCTGDIRLYRVGVKYIRSLA